MHQVRHDERKLSAPCLPLLAPFKPLRPLLRDSPLLSVAGTKRTLYVSLSCYEHFRTTFLLFSIMGALLMEPFHNRTKTVSPTWERGDVRRAPDRARALLLAHARSVLMGT
ncbi:unnamed protein product, partial [Laminaria digitata]